MTRTVLPRSGAMSVQQVATSCYVCVACVGIGVQTGVSLRALVLEGWVLIYSSTFFYLLERLLKSIMDHALATAIQKGAVDHAPLLVNGLALRFVMVGGWWWGLPKKMDDSFFQSASQGAR